MPFTMNYRIKTLGVVQCVGGKWSGVKVGSGRFWRLRLPEWETIQFADPTAYWSYINFYIGLDYIWYMDGQPQLNAVEYGVSIRATEYHDPVTRGWYPFANFTPKKQYPPFNDPDAWRRETPIPGRECILEIRLSGCELIEGSYRWNADYYVDREYQVTRYLYGGPDVNSFDAKVVAGLYMSTNDEDEISFGPARIENFQAGRADNVNFPDAKVWLPIKPDVLQNGEAGVEAVTAHNETQAREFVGQFDVNFNYATVALPPAGG